MKRQPWMALVEDQPFSESHFLALGKHPILACFHHCDCDGYVWHYLHDDAGGPDRSTDVLATLLYEHAFLHSRFGYATSIAMVYFIIVIVLTLLIFRVTRRETIEF